MAFDVNKWYNENNAGDVLYAYKGEVTSDLITSLLDKIEERLDERNEAPKVRKKLYNILVESLQNLYHHSSELKDQKSEICKENTVFIFKFAGDSFYVITGNFVESKRISYLKDRIDQINHLSKDELKALYKLILNNEEFSEKGGGGLGMIDIARKSEKKLKYQFHETNNSFHYFCFIVEI